mmetsp:Transcript_24163/g.47503  ORF Transcript_24163/g.47503 Transcript_24163/m.47503 type:complete len:220 (+) Transcript_24163:630-1289(+)
MGHCPLVSVLCNPLRLNLVIQYPLDIPVPVGEVQRDRHVVNPGGHQTVKPIVEQALDLQHNRDRFAPKVRNSPTERVAVHVYKHHMCEHNIHGNLVSDRQLLLQLLTHAPSALNDSPLGNGHICDLIVLIRVSIVCKCDQSDSMTLPKSPCRFHLPVEFVSRCRPSPEDRSLLLSPRQHFRLSLTGSLGILCIVRQHFGSINVVIRWNSQIRKSADFGL